MSVTRKGSRAAKATISPRPSLPGATYGVKRNTTKKQKTHASNVSKSVKAPKW